MTKIQALKRRIARHNQACREYEAAIAESIELFQAQGVLFVSTLEADSRGLAIEQRTDIISPAYI